MREYNMGDIATLEAMYYRMLPWITTHPNHGLYMDDIPNFPVCPNCGSGDIHKDGFAYTKVGKFQRYQCKTCHTWPRSRVSVNAGDPRNRRNILTQTAL
jgi:rubredoxin